MAGEGDIFELSKHFWSLGSLAISYRDAFSSNNCLMKT